MTIYVSNKKQESLYGYESEICPRVGEVIHDINSVKYSKVISVMHCIRDGVAGWKESAVEVIVTEAANA